MEPKPINSSIILAPQLSQINNQNPSLSPLIRDKINKFILEIKPYICHKNLLHKGMGSGAVFLNADYIEYKNPYCLQFNLQGTDRNYYRSSKNGLLKPRLFNVQIEFIINEDGFSYGDKVYPSFKALIDGLEQYTPRTNSYNFSKKFGLIEPDNQLPPVNVVQDLAYKCFALYPNATIAKVGRALLKCHGFISPYSYYVRRFEEGEAHRVYQMLHQDLGYLNRGGYCMAKRIYDIASDSSLVLLKGNKYLVKGGEIVRRPVYCSDNLKQFIVQAQKNKDLFSNIRILEYLISTTSDQEIWQVGEYLEECLADLDMNSLYIHSLKAITLQMIKAVVQLHSAGYVHRDIKLENYLFTDPRIINQSCIVKLGDLQFIEKLKCDHMKYQIVGTKELQPFAAFNFCKEITSGSLYALDLYALLISLNDLFNQYIKTHTFMIDCKLLDFLEGLIKQFSTWINLLNIEVENLKKIESYFEGNKFINLDIVEHDFFDLYIELENNLQEDILLKRDMLKKDFEERQETEVALNDIMYLDLIKQSIMEVQADKMPSIEELYIYMETAYENFMHSKVKL